MTESVVELARAVLARERADLSTRPGFIQSEATLQVHTEPARRLVVGSQSEDGRRIVGLFLFAPLVKRILSAAEAGDVYAQWFLVRIEQRFREGEDRLQSLANTVEETVKKRSKLKVTIRGSEKPLEVPLEFGNPYAYQGAELVGLFDDIVQELLVGKRMGRLTATAFGERLYEGSHAIRRIFHLAAEWKSLDAPITREEVQGETELAREAAEKMGEVPSEVLAGAMKPAWVVLGE